MSRWISSFKGGFRAESITLRRSRLFLVLTTLQSIAFLVLVSLFALTGSRAPVAIVSDDSGQYASEFIHELAATHHSFRIAVTTASEAERLMRRGEIVARITIPAGFSEAVLYGRDTTLRLDVDNIDTDMTDDVQRALPSAIVAFGRRERLPEIRAVVQETDLIDHDTDYIPYLAVSALVLDAFVIAVTLGASAVTREFESGGSRMLAVSPFGATAPVLGRAAACACSAFLMLLLPLAVVLFGYHIVPLHPMAVIAILAASITVFTAGGVVLGVIVKKTVPAVSLALGLSIPLYICSGSLEPARFDGPRLWFIGHFSPVYYAVSLLENAFHGLQVTPETQTVNALAMMGWAVGLVGTAVLMLRRLPA